MSRLPNVGGDDNQWGVILNDFLLVSHNADGTIKNSVVPKTALASTVQTSLGKADTAVQPSQLPGAATTSASGLVELATAAETIAGVDAVRAVTPAGLTSALSVGPAPVSLTDAATIVTNASLSNYFRVTIAGNRTLGAPSNPSDGQRVLWEVTAFGADRTLTLSSGTAGSFKFGSDITSVPVIVSGTTTFIGAVYRSVSARWHILAVGSGH